ncbi:MAG: serpin family protein, partial [Rhabdochlamydiaceae bacterium]
MAIRVLNNIVTEASNALMRISQGSKLAKSLLCIAFIIAVRISSKIPALVSYIRTNCPLKLKCVPRLPTFHDKVNYIAASVFEQFSRQTQIKNFSFFMPALLPSFLMLYAGAPPELKASFDQEFGLNQEGKSDDLHHDCAQWLQSLSNHRSGEPTMMMGQAVALKQGLALRGDVADTYRTYNAETISFETLNEAETLGNDWVKQKTDGVIQDLVHIDNPAITLMLLTAAIFNGTWLYPFDLSKTQKKIFNNGDGSKVSMDQMHASSDKYRTGLLGSSIRVLEVPFQGSIDMLIFLPNTENPQECNACLSKEMVPDNVMGFLKEPLSLQEERSLEIAIPKLNLKHETNLVEDLGSWKLIQKIKRTDFRSSFLDQLIPDAILVDKMAMQTNITLGEKG